MISFTLFINDMIAYLFLKLNDHILSNMLSISYFCHRNGI